MAAVAGRRLALQVYNAQGKLKTRPRFACSRIGHEHHLCHTKAATRVAGLVRQERPSEVGDILQGNWRLALIRLRRHANPHELLSRFEFLARNGIRDRG